MGERKFLQNKADGVRVYTRLGFKACFNCVVAFNDKGM